LISPVASTNHQIPPTSTEAYIETVFSAISKNNGKLNFKDLFTMLVEGGNTSRVHLYRAIAQLTKDGRIKRVKGIGKNGIDYFYYDTRFLKVRPSQLNTSSNAS
jgi:predicted transcriptional regulator